MRVGIIGAGRVGTGLAGFWVGAGHEVTVSGSRDTGKLERAAGEVGAKAGSVRDAVDAADVILLAVPWAAVGDALTEAGPLDGKTVVDATNNVQDDASSFEEVVRLAPGAHVVKAFNTVFAALYDELGASTTRPHMVFCGDDPGAKATVAQLIRDAGFDPVDAGGSEAAPAVEHFARLVINLAYGQGMGPFVYRFGRPAEF